MTGSVGDVQFKTFTFKNNFTTPFCGTVMDGGGGGGGVNCLKATEPPQRDSLVFTTWPLELPDTHLVTLRRMKS